MQPRLALVRGAHDLTLHLLEWSGEGVPLLLLHGFGNDAHIWDDFAPASRPTTARSRSTTAVTATRPGIPERRYEHEAMVADVEAR